MSVITVQNKLELLRQLQEGHSVAETAGRFGASKRAVFYWKKQFDGGLDSLIPKKRGPKLKVRRKVSSELEQEILQMRIGKNWGYRRIMWHLRRTKNIYLSKNCIRYWLRKHALPPRKRRKHKRRGGRRFLPNQKVLIDIKEHRIAGIGKVFTYVALDRCTRKMNAHCYLNKTTDNAIEFAKDTVKKFGLMNTIQIDNGRQFVYLVPKKKKRGRPKKRKSRRRKNRFGEFAESLGIKLKFIDFSSPTQNSHIERAIRTLKEEFLLCQRFEDVGGMNAALAQFLAQYNGDREHGGLDGKTPNDVWNEQRALSPYAQKYVESVQKLSAPNRAKII